MFDKPHRISTDEIAEQATLYCLGDFSPEERRMYEEHLSSCTVCRAEVEDSSELIAEIALADPIEPSEQARTAFLNRVHNEKLKGRLWAKLIGVLITPQLSSRPGRKKNPAQLVKAVRMLESKLSGTEQELLDAMVEAALKLCNAGTAGFSMLYEDEQVFRWDALAGALMAARGGTTPRTWSPCGTTLDLGSPQLFSLPSRCFEYFKDAPQQISEGLVVPVYVGANPLGTVWVASHDDHKFDKEDLQVLQSFADFCGAAVGIIRGRQRKPDSEARG